MAVSTDWKCSLRAGITYESFVDAMKRVMSFVIYLRRDGRRVVLNDVSISKVVALDADSRCSLRDGWAEHICAASNTHDVRIDSVVADAIAVELESKAPKTYIRGKWELWFFIAFTLRVVSVLTEKRPGDARISLRLQLSYANAIDVFAVRLLIPARLLEFLDRVLPA